MRNLRLIIAVLFAAIVPAATAAARYTVQPGDTLDAIGQRYGVSAQSIASANGLADPGAIVAGRTLFIPSSSSGGSSQASVNGSYTVRPGENLGAIAARYGTTADALARANGISNPNAIVAGTRITITSGGGTTRSTSSSGSSAGGYTVRSGDTLDAIGRRHGVSAQAIASANGIAVSDMIVVGKRLTIPTSSGATTSASSTTTSSGGHTVQPGENLGAIAARYGTTADALARANGISNPNAIVAGTRITITSGGGTTRSTSSSGSSAGGYTVRSGDTLDAIGRRHGVSAQAIASANGIAVSDMIVVGKRLTIPTSSGATTSASSTTTSSGGHTVQPGENLGAIAARYGTTADALARANGISNPNSIVAGTRITITSGGSTTTSTATTTMTPITAQTAGWSGHPSKDQVAAMINSSAA